MTTASITCHLTPSERAWCSSGDSCLRWSKYFCCQNCSGSPVIFSFPVLLRSAVLILTIVVDFLCLAFFRSLSPVSVSIYFQSQTFTKIPQLCCNIAWVIMQAFSISFNFIIIYLGPMNYLVEWFCFLLVKYVIFDYWCELLVYAF